MTEQRSFTSDMFQLFKTSNSSSVLQKSLKDKNDSQESLNYIPKYLKPYYMQFTTLYSRDQNSTYGYLINPM